MAPPRHRGVLLLSPSSRDNSKSHQALLIASSEVDVRAAVHRRRLRPAALTHSCDENHSVCVSSSLDLREHATLGDVIAARSSAKAHVDIRHVQASVGRGRIRGHS
jgi:hypothetical protein